MSSIPYPYGYTVTPLPPPKRLVLRAAIQPKAVQPPPSTTTNPYRPSEVHMQLTADQQVALTVSAEDAYGNPVDLTGTVTWESSDEAIVSIQDASNEGCTAVAVGPAGTASVTVKNDFNDDSTDDFQGSMAIDVVAGEVTEVVISAGEPTDKS